MVTTQRAGVIKLCSEHAHFFEELAYSLNCVLLLVVCVWVVPVKSEQAIDDTANISNILVFSCLEYGNYSGMMLLSVYSLLFI